MKHVLMIYFKLPGSETELPCLLIIFVDVQPVHGPWCVVNYSHQPSTFAQHVILTLLFLVTIFQEMAKDFPNSNFTGIDSGAFLPKDPASIPVNCMFHAQNTGEGILFAPETFDYIMQRHMVTAYDTTQWNTVTKELFRVTKPGGFVEIVELDAGRIIGGGNVARGAWRVGKKILLE